MYNNHNFHTIIKNIFFCVFLVVLLNNTNGLYVRSQSSPLVDYSCLLSIGTDLGLISGVPLDSSSTYYDFCNSGQPYQVACAGNTVNSILVQPSNSITISGSTFSCLTELPAISISDYNGCQLSPNFFTGSWLTYKFFLELFSYNTNGVSFSGGSINPNINKLSIYSTYQPNVITLPFSIFTNTESLIWSQPTNAFLINYNNDLVNNWNSKVINILSTNFPSFNNVIGPAVTVEMKASDSISLNDNIASCKNLTSLTIKSTFQLDFPTNLNNLEANSIAITYFGTLNKPPAMIDLSNMKGVTSLSITTSGASFSVNNAIPFIFPQSLKTFYSNSPMVGNVFDPTVYGGVTTLTLNSNVMGTLLPPTWDKTSKIKNLSLGFNSLTGTLDSSYCVVNLDVRNNQLTGLIPSCFTCFFGAKLSDITQTFKFQGNQFSNFASPGPCTSIIPNLILDKQYTDYSQFYIYGKSLGPDVTNIELYPNLICNTEIPSELLECKYMSTSLPPRTITLTYLSTLNAEMYKFTVSYDPLKPLITNVNWPSTGTGRQLTINGEYFSYNSTIINIKVGSDICVIEQATFYQIICSFPNVVTVTDKISFITVGSLDTQITLSSGIDNTVTSCPNDCNGNGICNTGSGVCSCNDNYQDPDCSILIYPCPVFNSMICNSPIGTCNNGTCVCPNDHFIGLTCSQCKENQWFGTSCEISYHYLTSISPSLTSGGNALFYGEFGTIQQDLSISINGKNCPILSNTSTVITCDAPTGQGVKNVIVKQNGVEYIGNDMYKYIELTFSCPKNCSNGNGFCNQTNGQCTCKNGFSSFDCSLSTAEKSIQQTLETIINIDPIIGGANIKNQEINFEIYFKSLQEIDINGNIVRNYTLQNNWIFDESAITPGSTDKIYTLTQSLTDNIGCQIISKIEEIETPTKEFTFAGSTFSLSKGNVKFTISIEKYNYQNNLNTLKLELISTVNNDQQEEQSNECNKEDTNYDIDEQSMFNYIKISKNNKILNGRFINQLLSDGRPTYFSTIIKNDTESNSIVLSFLLPHCIDSCLIDPDFSLLVSPNFKSTCENDKKSNNKWIIPVAVVVSVVGVACIIGGVALFYKKHSVGIRIQQYRLKRYTEDKLFMNKKY